MKTKLINQFRKLKNTFLPLAIKKVSTFDIRYGDEVYRVDAGTWERDSVHLPDWYIDLDPTAQVLLNEVTTYANTDDRILDICCNIGRHLNYLTDHGYRYLYGFDIMKPALDRMSRVFPKIDSSKIKHGNIVDVLPSYPDQCFDFAYTHSATLELIHPSFPAHSHLARIVKKGLVFLLYENGHTYPRYYEYLYNKAGFVSLKNTRIRAESGYFFNLYVFMKPEFVAEYASPVFLSRLESS